MPSDIRFVLLDLDGTLTDPFPGISRCIVYALQQLKVPVPDLQSLRHWIGPPLLDSFGTYFSTLELAHSPHDALQFYRQRFSSEGLFENSVYPGVAEMLGHLQAAPMKLYLATAKPIVFARRIMRHFQLAPFFDACHGSELDGTRTDKVELLQYIIEQEGIDPGGSAMVGDRHHDMVAARYHGMRAFGVTWGYGSESELLDAGAESLVATPAELQQVLMSDKGLGTRD